MISLHVELFLRKGVKLLFSLIACLCVAVCCFVPVWDSTLNDLACWFGLGFETGSGGVRQVTFLIILLTYLVYLLSYLPQPPEF